MLSLTSSAIVMDVSPFWRGILKASMTFVFGIKIKVGAVGCIIGFWLDHWVGDATLASLFPNLFLIVMDPSSMVNTQICLFEGKMIWVPQFRRWPYQHFAIDLNNLFTLLQPVILSTSISNICQWKLKENGLFIVNSLYRSLTGYRDETNCFR